MIVKRSRWLGLLGLSILNDFIWCSAALGHGDASEIPTGSGVYALLFRNGDRLLEAAGYGRADAQPWSLGDWHHLYTGRSATLRRRVALHLSKTLNHSNVRESLLALHSHGNALAATGLALDGRVDPESALSSWLTAQCRVGFVETSNPFELERNIIAATASPLNISGRKRQGFTAVLEGLRWRAALDRVSVASLLPA